MDAVMGSTLQYVRSEHQGRKWNGFAGEPARPSWGDSPVAVVKWVDGTGFGYGLACWVRLISKKFTGDWFYRTRASKGCEK